MWKSYVFRGEEAKLKTFLEGEVKPIIRELEGGGLIEGYLYSFSQEGGAFNLRFEMGGDQQRAQVLEALNRLTIKAEEQDYSEREDLRKSQELASRWGVALSDLVGKSRMDWESLKSPDFKVSLVHNLFNSLGLSLEDEARTYCQNLISLESKLANPHLKKIAKQVKEMLFVY